MKTGDGRDVDFEPVTLWEAVDESGHSMLVVVAQTFLEAAAEVERAIVLLNSEDRWKETQRRSVHSLRVVRQNAYMLDADAMLELLSSKRKENPS